MSSAIIVAIISFAGTLIGTAGGIVASSRLTNYRLEQLEKKMDVNASIISKMPVVEEKIASINRRVVSLERENIRSTGYFDGC